MGTAEIILYIGEAVLSAALLGVVEGYWRGIEVVAVPLPLGFALFFFSLGFWLQNNHVIAVGVGCATCFATFTGAGWADEKRGAG